MTLVELLVVLAILALLTTMAITSSDVVLGQGRYDATVRSLQEIQDAVLGPTNARQPDGAVVVSGFLADVGRLPLSLAELWSKPNGLAAFAIRPASDTDVRVGSGWRGPYLRLPIGVESLYDGWGNSYQVSTDANGWITAVTSLGADGQSGGSENYDADLSVTLNQQATITISGNVYVLDANGQRQNPTSGTAVKVVLYGPNPDNGGVLETTVLNAEATGGVVSYSVSTTQGPRCLRAYLGDPVTGRSDIVRVYRSNVVDLVIH
jgi:type II secretory pathway pseudopilin PulG